MLPVGSFQRPVFTQGQVHVVVSIVKIRKELKNFSCDKDGKYISSTTTLYTKKLCTKKLYFAFEMKTFCG